MTKQRAGGPPCLSDLSVTELLTLSRRGFLPRGLVIGVCVYDAGFEQRTTGRVHLGPLGAGLRHRVRAGYCPVSVALGNCVYAISRTPFMNARETAMHNLEADLDAELVKPGARGRPDAAVGVVGMTVEEVAPAGVASVIEYTAVGTAVARLRDDDPPREKELPAPQVVVPLDR